MIRTYIEPLLVSVGGFSLMEITDGLIKIGIGLLTVTYLVLKIIEQKRKMKKDERSN